MKNIALGILSLVLASNVVAQEKIAGSAVHPAIINYNSDKAIPDTIFHNFFNLAPVVYTAPVGGYMSGTNAYGETEKGQETKVEIPYFQTGVIYWFALKEKNSGGDTSSIIFKQYKKDAVQLVNGSPRYVPGSLQYADTVKLADVNVGNTFTAGLNLFAFPQPVVNYQSYVSTFSMELMNPQDTIAIYSTTDSLVDITDHSWEKWNGKWNTIKNAWTLDVDFGIFPVRDLTSASVDEHAMVEVKLFPNPATDFIQVKTSKQFDSYVILDATGRNVQTGSIASDAFSINTAEFEAGYYILGVYSGNGKDASFYRFIKQ